ALKKDGTVTGWGVGGSNTNLEENLIGKYAFEGSLQSASAGANSLQAFGSYQYVGDGHGGGQAIRMNGDRSLYYSNGGYMRAPFMENTNLPAVTFNFWTRRENLDGSLDPNDTALLVYSNRCARPNLKL
ncbi:MAG: hypothetical protein EBZ78_12930, partial [Verrucomicrobia bacterium]|nr:hypothetical protein [Verrucomicrobiota bacterium]